MQNYINEILNPTERQKPKKQIEAEMEKLKQKKRELFKRAVEKFEAKQNAAKGIFPEKQRTPEPEPIPKFEVPQSVWDKAKSNLIQFKKKDIKRLKQYADVPDFEKWKLRNCRNYKLQPRYAVEQCTLLKMMLASYEFRDWQSLYKIILYGLEDQDFRLGKRYYTIDKQIMTYFISAIQQDPVAIENDALNNFLVNVKKLSTSLEHTEFMKRLNEYGEELANSSDFENDDFEGDSVCKKSSNETEIDASDESSDDLEDDKAVNTNEEPQRKRIRTTGPLKSDDFVKFT